jgi:hypothetical protein
VSSAPPATTVVSNESTSKRRVAEVAGGSVVAMGATAVGCAALGVLGSVPAAIGIVVAAPVFAAAYFSVHAIRRHRKTSVALSAVVDEDAETLAALDRLLAQVHGKVPSTVEARVQRVANTVRQTIPRLDQLGTGSEQAHAVLRTATSYLPEAVAAYMRLPRDFADRRAVSNGKTSLTILCDQLDLLGSKMDDVFDAACRADADALIAHGRFLAEKFSSGALALDPQMR